MQDPRLRIAATILLSVAAFTSLAGTVAAFFWWLLFSGGRKALPSLPVAISIGLVVGLVGMMVQLTGGDGISYTLRIGMVLLIAAWAYHELQEGDLLRVSVWLLGDDIGFDTGLLAEMGIVSMTWIRYDLTTANHALVLKGVYDPLRRLLALGMTILHLQMERSREQAKVLAMRGYRGGGRACPVFQWKITDIPGIVLALAAFLFAFDAVRDVFIV